jgi:predicted DNA-binding ribbon-helix-helix protein
MTVLTADIPRKRSLTLNGHRTSISLEDAFWEALREISARELKSVSELVEKIDTARGDAGLSSAIRIYILQHYRGKIAC